MEKNYFTIGEVSRKVNIPEHTIRYWESKFSLIRPIRLSSGHRRYTRKDLETIGEIKDLLLIKGYSLAGARKVLNSRKTRAEQPAAPSREQSRKENLPYLKTLSELKKEIQDLVRELESME